MSCQRDWPLFLLKPAAWRGMRTLPTARQASAARASVAFLVGCVFDDAGGLREPCCRFQGRSRSVFISIGIGGGLRLL